MIPAIQPLPDDAPAQPIPSTPKRSVSDLARGCTRRPSLEPARHNRHQQTGDHSRCGRQRELRQGRFARQTRAANLDAYQQRLQGLLDTLTARTDAAIKPPTATPPSRCRRFRSSQEPGVWEQRRRPLRAAAATLGDAAGRRREHRQPQPDSPKGTAFTCALKTRLVNAASGSSAVRCCATSSAKTAAFS
jgi:hypothetical protein